MSEWKDALVDYVLDRLPDDFDLLPTYYQEKIYKELEDEFTERCELYGEMCADMQEDR